MVGARRIQQQTVIVIRSIHPCLREVCNIHGQQTIALLREVGKIGGAAVEIATRRRPGIPVRSRFVPTGGDSIDIGRLTGFVRPFIQIERGAGYRCVGWDGAQVELKQASAVCTIIRSNFKLVVGSIDSGR